MIASRTLWLLLVPLAVAGCDKMGQAVSDVLGAPDRVVVLPPGYNVAIEGSSVPILGSDVCPAAGSHYLYVGQGRTEVLEGRAGCAVLDSRKVAVVRVGGTVEAWKVFHEGEHAGARRVRLQRPNGDWVVPVAN